MVLVERAAVFGALAVEIHIGMRLAQQVAHGVEGVATVPLG
jgi:hypothetical protein